MQVGSPLYLLMAVLFIPYMKNKLNLKSSQTQNNQEISCKNLGPGFSSRKKKKKSENSENSRPYVGLYRGPLSLQKLTLNLSECVLLIQNHSPSSPVWVYRVTRLANSLKTNEFHQQTLSFQLLHASVWLDVEVSWKWGTQQVPHKGEDRERGRVRRGVGGGREHSWESEFFLIFTQFLQGRKASRLEGAG